MTIHESELPDGVLFASNKNDVSEAVKICNEFGCPIIPFGVGSSFEGHVNAPFGGLSIDLNNMNEILNVYQDDLLVTVQPGVTREQLNTHLRDTVYFFQLIQVQMHQLEACLQREHLEQMRLDMEQ